MSIMDGEANQCNDIIIVIHEAEVKQFMGTNAGLRRRINPHFVFPDYSPRQLAEIFINMAKTEGERFPDECSVNDIENEIQSKVSAEMIPRYNAGYSKQLYEKSQMVRDKRLVSILKNKGIVSKYDYVSIHLCDIREDLYFIDKAMLLSDCPSIPSYYVMTGPLYYDWSW